MSTPTLAIRMTADGRAVVAAAKQAEDALQGMVTKAGQAGGALQSVGQSSEGLQAAMRQVGQASVDASGGLIAVSEAVNAAGDGLGALASASEQAAQASEGLSSDLGGQVTALDMATDALWRERAAQMGVSQEAVRLTSRLDGQTAAQQAAARAALAGAQAQLDWDRIVRGNRTAAERLADELRELAEAGTRLGRSAEEIARQQARVRAAFDASERAAGGASAGLARLVSSSGLVSTAMGGAFVGALVAVQREFDVLNSSLITVTGGSAAAAREMQWIEEFAATTPYGLSEVTGAFVKMKAMGLDPSQAALASYGNTASAMGKNLDQMIEAVADAATGEFERLKEFGIRASVEGDKVALTFRGVTTSVGNNAGEITGYLQKIGSVDFAGAMEQRAKTLDGAISNFGDSWKKLLLTINQAGVGDAMASSVRAASAALGDLSGAVKATGQAFAENEATVTTTLGVLAGVAAAAGILRTATALGTLATGVGGVAGAVAALKLVVASLNPVTLVLLGLGAVVGGVAAYDNHWRATADGIKETIKQLQDANAQATGSLERMQGRPEVIEAINKAIGERSHKIAELTGSLKALNAQAATAKAPTGSVGSGDTALLRAQRSEYDASARAAAEFWAKNQTGVQKMAAELKAARESMKASFSPEIEAAIRKKYDTATAGASGAAAAVKREASEYEKLITAVRGKTAANELELASIDALTESQKIRVKLDTELASGALKLTAINEQAVRAEIDRLATSERALQLEKDRVKVMQALFEEQQSITDEINQAAVAASQAREQGRLSIDAYAQGIAESNAAIEFELTLMGKTAVERQVALADYAIELALKKQIAEIDKNAGFDEAQREEARVRARDAAAQAKTGVRMQAEGQAHIDMWQSIDSTAKDVFTNVFENGADTFKRLGQTLKASLLDLLYQMTIKKWIVNISGQVSGMGSAGGSAGQALTGGGVGLGDIKSMFSAMNNSVSNTIGTQFAKFATSSSGQSLGLSTGAGAEVFPGQGSVLTGAGQTASAALQMAGNAMAGYAMGELARGMISNGYSAGKGMDTFQKIGIGAASAVFGPVIGALVGVGAGIFNRVFGRKLKDSGIEGTFGGQEGFTGSNFEFHKGGLLRSDKTKRSPLDQEVQNALALSFKTMRSQVGTFAAVLGLNTDKIAGFTTSIKVSLKGLSEADASAAIDNALLETNNKLAEQVLGTWAKATTEAQKLVLDFSPGNDKGGVSFSAGQETLEKLEYTASTFAREGEGAADTLSRLATSLLTVNGIWETLGNTVLDSSMVGGDAASNIADIFGGLEKLSAVASSYYENFYTDAERVGTSVRQMGEGFTKMGLALPDVAAEDAIEQFRALVDAQDRGTDSGLAYYAALLNLSGEFYGLVQASKELGAGLKTLTTEQKSLEIDLLAAQGNTAEATRMRLRMETLGMTEAEAAVFRLNAALRDQIRVAESLASLKADEAGLYADLAEAQGNLALAAQLRFAIETKGMGEAEIAAYKYNASLRAQITVANEAAGLQDRLNAATDTVAQAAARARNAIDPLNRALYDTVTAAETVNSLVNAAGIGADAIGEKFLEVILGREDAKKAGEAISKMVSDGIYSALATGFAQQISQMLVSTVITPMVQAAVAGTSISAAVSQDAISNMLTAAKAASAVLGTLFADEGFKTAMADISTAIGGATQAMVQPIVSLAPAADNAAASVQSLGSTLERFGDKLKARVDLLTGDTGGVVLAKRPSLTTGVRNDTGGFRIGKISEGIAEETKWLQHAVDGGFKIQRGPIHEFWRFAEFFEDMGTFTRALGKDLAASADTAVGSALNLVAVSDYFTDIGTEIGKIQAGLATAAQLAGEQVVGNEWVVAATTTGFAGAIGTAATQIGGIINASVLAKIPEAIRNSPALAGVSTSIMSIISSVGKDDVQGVNDGFLLLSGALTRGELTAAQYAAAIGFVTDSFTGVAEAAAGVVDQLSIRKDLERQILELTGDTAALRLLDIAGMNAANVALYDRVKALQKEAQVTQERNGLMTSLFQALGNTGALRAQQLAGLAPSNRALQQQVFAIEDAKAALQKALDAESKNAQAASQAAQERVSTLKSISDALKSNVESLRGTVESTKQWTADQANAFLDNALSNARSTGYMPDADALTDAIAGARAGLDKRYASEFDREFETLVLAGKLSELKDISGGQLTTAERQLRAAESQVDALNGMREQGQALLDSLSGNTTATLSIVDAIAQLSSAVLSVASSATAASLALARGVPAGAGGGSGGGSVGAGGGSASAAWGSGGFASDGLQLTDASLAKDAPELAAAKVLYKSMTGGVDSSLFEKYTAQFGGASFLDRGGFDGATAAEDLRARYSFAVGINRVPYDMDARIHEGEAVVPAAFNPFNPNASQNGLGGNTERLESLVEGLTKEVQRLQSIVTDGNRSNERIATAVNGNPDRPMRIDVVENSAGLATA